MSIARSDRLELVCFAVLSFCFLWRLGSYPPWFDHIVGIAIWPQLNHVYDQQAYPLDGWARWQWQDMYQHNAGYSPTYGSLVELGLKIFGLSLIAVRLPQTVLVLGLCAFGYFALREVTSKTYALLCALLLGTAPWFLILMRSGGIIGFGGANLILAGACACLLFARSSRSHPRTLLAFITAIAVALLPYAHTSTRLFVVLFAILIPLSYRIIGAKAAGVFVITLLLTMGPQLLDWQHAKSVFFNARGETLMQVAANYSGPAHLEFIRTKLTENFLILARLLLSLNPSDSFWFANLADSYWSPQAVLYPKFLVPFFLLGIVFSVQALIQRHSIKHGLLLGLLGLCCIPSLMSGYGGPNEARLFLTVIPLYMLIAYAGLELYRRWLGRIALFKYAALLGLLVTVGLQIHNLFYFEKGGLDEKMSYRHLVQYYQLTRQQCPQATVVLHEFPDFGVYSYVMIRWLGGPELENEIKQHRVWLLRHDNIPQIQTALQQAPQAVVISHSGSTEQLTALGTSLPKKLVAPDELAVYGKACTVTNVGF